MSQDAALSALTPALPQVPAKLPLSLSILFGIAGLFLFVSTQIMIAAGAAIWAIGGYFHLGIAGFSVLATLLAVPALYACWRVLVMAIDAERDPANN